MNTVPEFSKNQILCALGEHTMLAFDWEQEQLYYFDCPNAQEMQDVLRGLCAEHDLLHPISELRDPDLINQLEDMDIWDI